MDKRKLPTKITSELLDKLKTLVLEGRKNKEICEILGIGTTTLRNYKNKLNITYNKPTADDIKEDIIKMYKDGKTVKLICSITGYKSPTTIKNILNKYNIESNKEKELSILRDKLKEIIPQCHSVYEVSKKVGCAPTTVRKYMKEYGLNLNLKYELSDSDIENISLEPLKYDFDSKIINIPIDDKKEFIENKIRHIIVKTRKYVPIILLKEYGINGSLISYHKINVPEINKEFGLTIKYASALEAYFAQFCENRGILYESQKTFDDCIYKGNLRFDYYLPEYDVLIEIHGKQHYEAIDMFGGNDFLKEQIEKDRIKKEWCEKNNKELYIICYKDLYKINYLDDVIAQIVAKRKLGELLETPEVDNQQPS